MRKSLMGVIAAVVVVLLIPLADGILVKSRVLQLIDMYQSMHPNSKFKVHINSYNIGWFKSTAQVSLLSATDDPELAKYGLPPVEFKADYVIHHGPILSFNNQTKFGMAVVDQYFHLPAFFAMFIPDTTNGAMQTQTLLGFSSDNITSNITIPAIALGPFAQWDGLTGSSSARISNNQLTHVATSFALGKISASGMRAPISVNVEPMNYSDNLSLQDNAITNLIMDFQTNTISVSSGNDNFSVKDLGFHQSINLKQNLYDFDTKFRIHNLQVSNLGAFNSLPEIDFEISGMNINKAGVTQLKELIKSHDTLNATDPDAQNRMNYALLNAYLAMLAPNTSFATQLSVDTTAFGGGSVILSTQMAQQPKTYTDLDTMMNFTVQTSIAKPLVTELAKEYLTYYANQEYQKSLQTAYANTTTPTDFDTMKANYDKVIVQIPTMATNMITGLIQQGILLDKGDKLEMNLNKTGTSVTLNGKNNPDIANTIHTLIVQGPAAAAAAAAMPQAPNNAPAATQPAPNAVPASPVAAQPAANAVPASPAAAQPAANPTPQLPGAAPQLR